MACVKLKQLGVGRRQSDDPMFAAGDGLCRIFLREGIVDIDDTQLSYKVVALFPCEAPGCTETFNSVPEFEMHYNSQHRFICKECRKPLASAHFLDLHISETHDSFFATLAERKPMYQCFVEDCRVVSQNVSERRNHCVEVHKFPRDFRYDQSLKKNKNQNYNGKKAQVAQGEEAMVVDDLQEKKPKKVEPFMFGHAKQGKAFAHMKPWHTKGKKKGQKKESNDSENKDISTSELMEALPS